VPLIDHNPRKGEKREFAAHEAQRFKTRSGAERCNARLKRDLQNSKPQHGGNTSVLNI
jgi:hypothetical protein